MKHRWIANLDMYRKVPIDLLEGSKRGSFISWMALVVMITLFVLETKEFLSRSIQTDMALDSNPTHDKLLRVNFNITMMDLPCHYASINVMSVFSGKQYTQTNTSRLHVVKYSVDANMVQRQAMESRNAINHNRNRNHPHDVVELHDVSVVESLEDMISQKQRQDAVLLSPSELHDALQYYMFVFVDFYAGWCSHCRVLEPTYEKLAEIIRDAAHSHVMSQQAQQQQQQQAQTLDLPPPQDSNYTTEEYESALMVNLPVLVAKVDCVEHHSFCMEQGIMGYPTLRLFVNGQKETDYHGNRNIVGMTQFLKFVEEQHRQEYDERKMKHTDAILEQQFNLTDRDRHEAGVLERERHQWSHYKWNPDDHPGCQLSGHLLMDRAPGHFYIQAQSQHYDLAPSMTNLSHRINHLSFGEYDAMQSLTTILKRDKHLVFPTNFQESIQPLDGNMYVTTQLHEAYHHYLKLVPTNVWSYRVVPSTQLATYATNVIPEAKFILDLSPIAVTYRPKTRRWYDYITSIMAIIGGTFTVVGMLEGGIRQLAAKRRHGHGRKMQQGSDAVLRGTQQVQVPSHPRQHSHAY